MGGKEAVARRAAELVANAEPEILGVGSGTTVRLFIKYLKELGFNGLTVPTSLDTSLMLKSYGFKVLELMSVDEVDLSVDGADEVFVVTGNVYAIKGGGGAMLREKVLASISKRRIYIVDEGKVSVKPCERGVPIPIEVVPPALPAVTKALEELEVPWRLREAGGKLGPVVTDNGNVVIDLSCPEALQSIEKIERIVGVAVSGLFGPELIDEVLVGEKGKLP